MKIRTENKNGNIKIYVNDVLHVSFNIANLIGIQSYMTNNFYTIDLYMKGSMVILLEYGTMEKWIAVLAELNKIEL